MTSGNQPTDEQIRGVVDDFVAEREEYVTAILACPAANQEDFHRWIGQAVARQQLSDRLAELAKSAATDSEGGSDADMLRTSTFHAAVAAVQATFRPGEDDVWPTNSREYAIYVAERVVEALTAGGWRPPAPAEGEEIGDDVAKNGHIAFSEFHGERAAHALKSAGLLASPPGAKVAEQQDGEA